MGAQQSSKAAQAATLVRKYPQTARQNIPPPPPLPTQTEEIPALDLNQVLSELGTQITVDRMPELPRPKHMPLDRTSGRDKGLKEELLASGKINLSGIARAYAELRDGRNVFDEYGISKEDQVRLYRHLSVPVQVIVDKYRTDCYFEAYPDWIQVGEVKGTLGLEYIRTSSHSAILKKQRDLEEEQRKQLEESSKNKQQES